MDDGSSESRSIRRAFVAVDVVSDPVCSNGFLDNRFLKSTPIFSARIPTPFPKSALSESVSRDFRHETRRGSRVEPFAFAETDSSRDMANTYRRTTTFRLPRIRTKDELFKVRPPSPVLRMGKSAPFRHRPRSLSTSARLPVATRASAFRRHAGRRPPAPHSRVAMARDWHLLESLRTRPAKRTTLL